MGGGGPSVPKPSAEERQLQRAQAEQLALQTELLKQQQAQNKVLLPFLAQQEGFDVTLDDAGNITSIAKRADPLEDQNKEIQRLFNERSLQALKGELPVDPALEEDLQVQERELRATLANRLGPGYDTSTPGIEALGEFFRTSEILREGARTGQLTLAEQLGITRDQQDIFRRQSSQDVLGQYAVANPMTVAGAHGQVARGYGQAQIPYIQNRQMQFQANVAHQQNLYGLLGATIGAAGTAAAAFSDEMGKEDLIPISRTVSGIPIYVYTRKDTGERMIGVLASDVELIAPDAVGIRGGWKAVSYDNLPF